MRHTKSIEIKPITDSYFFKMAITFLIIIYLLSHCNADCNKNSYLSRMTCDNILSTDFMNSPNFDDIAVLEIVDSPIKSLPTFSKTQWPNLQILILKNTTQLMCSKIDDFKNNLPMIHLDHDKSCTKTYMGINNCAFTYYNTLLCTNLNQFPTFNPSIRDRIVFLDIFNSTLNYLPDVKNQSIWTNLEIVTLRNVSGLTCDRIDDQRSSEIIIDHDVDCMPEKYFVQEKFKNKCSVYFDVILQCFETNTLAVVDESQNSKILFYDVKRSSILNLDVITHENFPNLEWVTLIETPNIDCVAVEMLRQRMNVYVEHDDSCVADVNVVHKSSNERWFTIPASVDRAEKLTTEQLINTDYLVIEAELEHESCESKTTFYQLIALLIICGIILVLKGKKELVIFLHKLCARRQGSHVVV